MRQPDPVHPIDAHPAASIRIPPAALKYILLQRTELQQLHRISHLLRLPYHLLFAGLESTWRSGEIRKEFLGVIQRDYDSMREYLPPDPKRVLDIGCGVAGIDVLLFRHYGKDADLTFFLLDRTEIGRSVFYGFRHEAAFYNSLDVAKDLLMMNGVSAGRIITLQASPDYRLGVGGLDLVISLLAWGFHFPIRTYLDDVYASMNEGARLIVDVRKDTTGIDDLQERFGNVLVLEEDKKAERVTSVRNSVP